MRVTRASIIWAIVAGLLSALLSFYIGTGVLMAAARAPDTLWQVPIAFLLPVAVPVGLVTLLAREQNRVVIAGVGIAATILGYLLFLGWYQLDRVIGSQEVTFVNNTGQEVVVYYQFEGKGLGRGSPLTTGEVYKDPIGFGRQGSSLRVVAVGKGSSKTALRQMTLDEYYQLFPWGIRPDQEKNLGDRKIFDHTFTWDELRELGGRVVLTDTRGSS